ncbi:hypothetical protein [Dysgonomonas termitidis]|uniref:Uncharacterized protein n=1 Tax=Dysgonomonas termitidis TaxID=1516126 RepID=A0ABV9L2K2_9BACT
MKQTIPIPPGCIAIIDPEDKIVIIEEKKFVPKRGDILYSLSYGIEFIFIHQELVAKLSYKYFACCRIKNKDLDIHGILFTEGNPRPATPEEQQTLFDALAKDGKRWNPDTLRLEDIEKDVLLPEHIHIYKIEINSILDYGDLLHIGFNDDKQLLGFNDGNFDVNINRYSLSSFFKKVQCKLTPCKREDLKPGDTAVCLSVKKEIHNIDLCNICKVLDHEKVVCLNVRGDIITCPWPTEDCNWYKVIPPLKD